MKINKIFSALFGGALLFGAAACTDEVEYTPATNLTGQGVYLSSSESDVVEIAIDATSATINLYRVNTAGTLTVGLSGEVLDAEGNPVPDIFSVPAQVTFPDGADVVPIEIGVIFGKVVPEEEYSLDLKIEGEDAQLNPYGLTSREYILTYAPWSEWEIVKDDDSTEFTIVFNTWLRGTGHLPVWSRKSIVNDNKLQFMIADPQTLDLEDPEFDPLTDCTWYYILSVDKSQTIDVDGRTCYLVTSNVVDVKHTYSTGEKGYFACAYTLCTDVVGGSHEEALAIMQANGWEQSYYDEEKGLIAVYTVYFAVGDGVFPQADAWEYVMFPSYQDYWIEFAYNGNYVDTELQEVAIIKADRSADITSYAYRCEQGELSAEEISAVVADMKADTEAELVFDESTNLTFALPADGSYTIVAVGYDEGGNAVYETSYTFSYESVMKASEWESIGWCLYTDGFFVNAWYKPSLGGQTWEVEIQEHKERPGYYRLVNPYKEWPVNLSVDGAMTVSGNHYMVINAEDPDGVLLEQFNSGINIGLATGEQTGECIFSSMAWNYLINGKDFELIKKYGYCGTLKDDLITFPAGTLLYAESEYQNGVFVYANLDPENPVYSNPQMKDPDWYFGTGTFCVDLSTVEKVQRKSNKAVAPANQASFQKLPNTTSVAGSSKSFRGVKKDSKEVYGDRKVCKTDVVLGK